MTAVYFKDCPTEIFYHYCDVCETDEKGNYVENNRSSGNLVVIKHKDCAICIDCFLKIGTDTFGICNKEKNKVRRTTIKEPLRNKLLDKAGHECEKCKSKEKLEIDHIIPFSLGGKTEEGNLQVLCKKCNLKKRWK